MINWILIIIIALAAFLIFRFVISKHSRHRLLMTVIMVIILVFIASFYFVSVQNNVDLTTVNGFGTGLVFYSGWIFHVTQNMIVLTGDAIGMDWRGTNETVAQNVSNVNLIDSGKNVGAIVVNETANTVNRVIKPNTPKPITTYK